MDTHSERAVSPVVGVVMMIAVTVLLGSMVGAAVLAYGDQLTEQPPIAAVTVSFETDQATVAHTGGMPVDTAQIRIDTPRAVTVTRPQQLRVGAPITIRTADGSAWAGERLQVRWEGDGGRSVVLAEATAPTASG
ncbi:MAG: type IV pilin N-terminal domain-containing protein [Haloquadratum sp.]|jgi:flagellin-like protein|nr:type IV pilin N-terminal domain-containing protein [Haloferacaceae archaeon]MDR9445363.1 type IV pilin N-terminal domain-containing protein [Haloquadratum sp.]